MNGRSDQIRRSIRHAAARPAGAALIAALAAVMVSTTLTGSGTGLGLGMSPHAKPAFAQGGEEHVVTITAREATGLAAFDATILFDPDRVTFVEVRPGDFLPEGRQMLGPEVGEDGSVTFGAFSPDGTTVDGEGTLAEAVFTTAGDSAPELRLDDARSGLYGVDGTPLGPPASLSALGVAAEAIYLPFMQLRRPSSH